MLFLDKSRLTWVYPVVVSCITLSACGGGSGSGSSVLADNMVVSIADDTQGSRSTGLATTADATSPAGDTTVAQSTTPSVAIDASVAQTPAATDNAATSSDASTSTTSTADATAAALGYRRNGGSSSGKSTGTSTTAATTSSPTATATATTGTTTTTASTTAPASTTTSTTTSSTSSTAPATTTTSPAPTAPAASAPSSPSTSAPQVTASFSATTTNFPNPERGFYGWGADYLQNMTAANLASLRDSAGLRLTLGLIDLSAYRTSAIPQSFLDTLTAKFALLRSNGMKVIVRAVYNYDSSGSDASVAQLKAHLTQLAPVFAANVDVIAYFQGGFIGAWGEWHDSASGLASDANKAAVRDALLAAVPAQMPVQFRYPTDVIKWYPTALSASQAFGGSAQARAGVHNDCFMSSDNDVGTYSISSLTNNSQRTYTKAITEYVPFGGETCSGFSPTRQKCADILSEGPGYHLAYLNINFYTAFMNQWKSEGCYDQVARSMGYRFQLDQIAHPQNAAPNSTVAFAINLRNVGWSRIFSARKLVVTLRNKSTGALISGTGTTDMRTLPSQASASTQAVVNVAIPAGTAAGNYAVLLSMPDVYTTTASDARFSVRFANADSTVAAQSWDATNGRFDVGTVLTVQ